MQLIPNKYSTRLVERLWDLWCIVSVIGIWPRFIEPELLFSSEHIIAVSDLPRELEGLKIVQLSDLHYSNHTKAYFLDRIVKKVNRLTPDIIVFTGDLLTYSTLINQEALHCFLSSLQAPLGSFAIFGNHDYSEYVTLANDGSFVKTKNRPADIMKGFSRLFSSSNDEDVLPVVEPIQELDGLYDLFKRSGFSVLHNETIHVGRSHAWLNLTGLGDIMTKQCLPQKAFQNYDMQAPGVVLSHNPDSFNLLQAYPGNLYLFGHTHGGQVNLPYIWKKVTPIKNKMLKSGLFHLKDRDLYVNRGLGAPFPFRWFSPPEIACLTLVRKGPIKEPTWQKIFKQEAAPEAALGTSKSIGFNA